VVAALNLVGQRFDRLLVVGVGKIVGSAKYWRCACDCGGESLRTAGNLKKPKHLGCKVCEAEVRGIAPRKHGSAPRHAARPRLYRIWKAMRQRCNDPAQAGWKYYGGRGVKVCAEWDDFVAFKRWTESAGYSDDLTIDRINGALGYEPGNCRWATKAEQTANRRPWGSCR
jgi:hypothetical protein